MKKTLALILAVLMFLCLAACQNSSNAEIEALQLQMQLMQEQLDEAREAGNASPAPAAESAPEPTAVPVTAEPAPIEEESGYPVVALHSTIDGQTGIVIDGATELMAIADIPEGMAVDYWELNGMQYYEDMEETFSFIAEGATVVDARLRPEHKVTTINATMQFLDAKGKPKGDEFTEFVFEEDYENPVTHETQFGDWITVYVEADVPKGYAVDYWLINDVPYYFNRTVSNFTVIDLNETTVYEVVLKKESASSATPKPAAKPTPTPAPTQQPREPAPTPTPTPAPTPEPVMYSVRCSDCKFYGGGYNGATSGMVSAGSEILVVTDYKYEGYWEGSYVAGDRWHDAKLKSFSYTVNNNCTFKHERIIN